MLFVVSGFEIWFEICPSLVRTTSHCDLTVTWPSMIMIQLFIVLWSGSDRGELLDSADLRAKSDSVKW